MIDWSHIKSTITSQVSRLSGLSTGSVRWVDEVNPLVNGVLPVIWLRISSITDIGGEEERYQDVDADTSQRNMAGQRQFVLSIRCESFTPDIASSSHAANIIQNLKIRLWRSTSIEERAGYFAIANYIGSKFFSYIEDSRPINTYVCDFLCNTADNDLDDSTGSGDVIEEAQIHGDLKDEDGNTVESVDIDADTH